MAKHWQVVKEEIENELDKIFFNEPIEVTMSKMGVYPSGAGTDGQILGNLLFQVADTQAMGWWTIEPAMLAAMEDDTFTLEHLKRMWKYLTVHMANLMGEESHPNCPAPWLNMPKLFNFCKDIVDSFDTVQTKEELKSLLWSWENYVNCLNRWFFLVFPWEVGKLLPRRDKEDIKKLAELAGMRVI